MRAPPPVDPTMTAIPPEVVEPFTATVRVDPSPGGKKAQPVWLEREDGDRWVAAYHPDDCWLAIDGQTMQVAGERYHPPGQALSAPHIRVRSLHSPAPRPEDTLVQVGPEQTWTGRLVMAQGAQGAKSEGAEWLVFEPDGDTSGHSHFIVFNPSAVSEVVGAPAEVTGRVVELSPFSAHVAGLRLCVLSAKALP
jgi:hypothetical protein